MFYKGGVRWGEGGRREGGGGVGGLREESRLCERVVYERLSNRGPICGLRVSVLERACTRQRV